MIPKDHQILGVKEALPIINKYNIVYFNWEERTGKTLPAIILQEQIGSKYVLILTKKKALDGWRQTLNSYQPNFKYLLTNYHQAKKIKKDKFTSAIIDEAHEYLSGFPKQSQTQKTVKSLVFDLPITYLSATSNAQGYHLLFHQFDISKYSPFAQFKNYYQWWNKFGISNTIWLYGKSVEQYNKIKPEVWDLVKHLFITKTRSEIGFEHEPEDVLHYIELAEETKYAYNSLQKDKVIELRGKDFVCDTSAKLRASLHMLEGGVLKDKKVRKNKKGLLKEYPIYMVLINNEKVNYILDKWGDEPNIVIMYNYIAEREKLETVFKRAKILQATSYAEGVDLSMYDHLIIYSQNWSTAKHSQRRARQANINRKDPIKVHFLLVKNAISDQVYKTVSVNKANFVDATYMETEV